MTRWLIWPYVFNHWGQTLLKVLRGIPHFSPCISLHTIIKWMPVLLPPHLYSLQEPPLLHSEGLSLICLPRLSFVIPVTGHLGCMCPAAWSISTKYLTALVFFLSVNIRKLKTRICLKCYFRVCHQYKNIVVSPIWLYFLSFLCFVTVMSSGMKIFLIQCKLYGNVNSVQRSRIFMLLRYEDSGWRFVFCFVLCVSVKLYISILMCIFLSGVGLGPWL